MITIFNRREVYRTDSQDNQVKTRVLLAESDVQFSMKTVRKASSKGDTKKSPDGIYDYVFYVKKENYDRADYLIRKGIRE